MFHKASVRLAGLYLAIMMFISLGFSMSIYQLSVQEFDRGLRRPDYIIQGEGGVSVGGFSVGPLRQTILQRQEESYQKAKNRVLDRLIFANLLILLGGGFLCYFLALRTLKPVEEAHQALERFTADASHELRTPIAAMRTEIEVALMNPKLTLKQSKQILESNVEELAKLTALAEGLLKLAQNGAAADHEVLNLVEVADDAVARVQAQADKKRIRIEITSEPEVILQGSQIGLTEAVVAILDNAVKYSAEKSIVGVAISTSQDQARIVISDQGIGMKPKEAEHIFERFYRADSARSKTTTGGYGIGLALAKGIVDAHGGTISVKSKYGKGSTFIISLPEVS